MSRSRQERPGDDDKVLEAAKKAAVQPFEALVRLRMVELAHRSDREPSQVLDVAGAYTDWIVNGQRPAGQGHG
ncbi:MAG: hypothetical protein ACK4RV_02260 [Caulobacter sp.]